MILQQIRWRSRCENTDRKFAKMENNVILLITFGGFWKIQLFLIKILFILIYVIGLIVILIKIDKYI